MGCKVIISSSKVRRWTKSDLRLRLCAGSGSNHDRTNKSSPPTLANHAAKGSYLGIDLDLEVSDLPGRRTEIIHKGSIDLFGGGTGTEEGKGEGNLPLGGGVGTLGQSREEGKDTRKTTKDG